MAPRVYLLGVERSTVFTTAVAHLANASAAKGKKDGHEESMWINER